MCLLLSGCSYEYNRVFSMDKESALRFACYSEAYKKGNKKSFFKNDNCYGIKEEFTRVDLGKGFLQAVFPEDYCSQASRDAGFKNWAIKGGCLAFNSEPELVDLDESKIKVWLGRLKIN